MHYCNVFNLIRSIQRHSPVKKRRRWKQFAAVLGIRKIGEKLVGIPREDIKLYQTHFEWLVETFLEVDA